MTSRRIDQTLSAYLPMDRRQALVRGLTLPEQTSGAALFADISGFSLLTEVLAKAAVATGPARRYLVGDPAIQLLDVLAGKTLVRMAAAEQRTGKGEVVVDETTALTLGGSVRVES